MNSTPVQGKESVFHCFFHWLCFSSLGISCDYKQEVALTSYPCSNHPSALPPLQKQTDQKSGKKKKTTQKQSFGRSRSSYIELHWIFLWLFFSVSFLTFKYRKKNVGTLKIVLVTKDRCFFGCRPLWQE